MRRHFAFSRLFIAVASSSVTIGAAAQQPDPQQLLQMLLQRGNMQASAQQAANRPALPKVSEAALAQQLATWPAANRPFAVERFRDGFSIEGERVLDSEGRIAQFAIDRVTGDAAYLMETMPGQFVIKLMRHLAGAPVTIATASRQMGTWSVETVSGVRASGSRLNLNPRGFFISRDNALFRYVAGTGMRSFGLPETHTMAAHQNGNLGETGWMLLEKRRETKEREGGILSQGSLGQFMGAVRGLGAAIGVSKSNSDYALYSIETQKMIPIGIALDEKQASFLSQCRQRNRWVAQCDRLDSIDSLYGQDGNANRSHYFWRVSWYKTTNGPVALVMEDGITKIDAIDLNTERRVTVFQRALGIGDWSTAQQADGRVQVKAGLGFESAVNEDVAQLLGETVAVRQN